MGEIKAYRDRQAPDHVNTMLPADIAAPVWHVDDIHVQMPSTGPISYTVQAGDTLSGIAGTSDPTTMGMLMYLNGLSDSHIEPGHPLLSESLSDFSSDQLEQFRQRGQALLKSDDAVIAARASRTADLAVLENLQVGPGVVDRFAGGGTADAGDAYAGYSLATAGTGVGSVPADMPNANLPFDPDTQILIGAAKGVINTPTTLINAEQRIKSWYASLTGAADQMLPGGAVPGLLGAGQGEWSGLTYSEAPPIVSYSNAYQQFGGDFSGVAMLAIPGLGEADGVGLYADGLSLLRRGGANASEVLDASGGSFLVPDSGANSLINGARLNMQLAAEQAAGVRMPTQITGYSDHALEQIAARDGGIGVSQDALLDAWTNPAKMEYVPSKYGPTFRLTGNNAVIVVNADGKVVTGWAKSAAGTGQ